MVQCAIQILVVIACLVLTAPSSVSHPGFWLRIRIGNWNLVLYQMRIWICQLRGIYMKHISYAICSKLPRNICGDTYSRCWDLPQEHGSELPASKFYKRNSQNTAWRSRLAVKFRLTYYFPLTGGTRRTHLHMWRTKVFEEIHFFWDKTYEVSFGWLQIFLNRC